MGGTSPWRPVSAGGCGGSSTPTGCASSPPGSCPACSTPCSSARRISTSSGRERLPGGGSWTGVSASSGPKYAEALAEYRRLYEHKIRILRDWEEHPSLLDTLEEFNLRMAQTGALLIHYRAHFVKRLREVTPPIHRDFSGGREELGLRL